MTEHISFPPLRDLSPKTLETRKRHLLSEIRREPERRHVRLRVAVPALAATCVAAACAVVFSGALRSPGTHRPPANVGINWSPQNSNLPAGFPPTLAHPLLEGRQVTLSDAAASLGTPIALPNTTLVQPSDAGPVWINSLHDKEGNTVVTHVAVTFPSQGVIVGYTRPAPSDGSAAHFQAMTKSMPSPSGASEGRVITLSGGVPALAVQQNSDDTGHNFGAIVFNMGGSEVGVIGHYDEATLQAMAVSILDQSGDSQ
jgi:hypothetical protein